MPSQCRGECGVQPIPKHCVANWADRTVWEPHCQNGMGSTIFCSKKEYFLQSWSWFLPTGSFMGRAGTVWVRVWASGMTQYVVEATNMDILTSWPGLLAFCFGFFYLWLQSACWEQMSESHRGKALFPSLLSKMLLSKRTVKHDGVWKDEKQLVQNAALQAAYWGGWGLGEYQQQHTCLPGGPVKDHSKLGQLKLPHLIVAFWFFKGAYRKGGDGLFSRVSCDMTKGDGLN